MQRTLALGAIWTASAAGAVGLGFLAVSLVDASASPGTTPVASSETSSSAEASTTTSPAPVTSATGEHQTVAGTVFANCTGGSPVLAGAPAAGWWVDDSNDPGQIEFENDTQKLEVHVVCSNGGPVFSVEGPRASSSGNGGGDDGSSTAPSTNSNSSTAPSTNSSSPAAPSSDDHGGDRGGHGSDDAGSNSGSGNSGSGSDSGGHG